MPRAATGEVQSYEWSDGRTVTWRLRVRAYGHRHRVTLGTNHEGWSRERALVELDRIVAQIERGTWQPPSMVVRESGCAGDETLHVTASRWWQRREGELRPKTVVDYRWRLDYLLGYLAGEPTASIDARKVDDFRQKLVGRGLGARSVNMVLDLLAQVLDDAVEYGLVDTNAARGKRRRMRVPRPRRTFLEPDQVIALLDSAGAWEASLPAHRRCGRRAMLACLTLAGLRVSELVAADRDDLDLAGGRLRVRDSKTEAGVRQVELTGFLLDELLTYVADRQPAGPLFQTSRGRRQDADNIRKRLLAPAVERANLVRGDLPSLPPVTPHSLRRTFASLALAAGRDPRWVMAQMGHTDARLTLSIYAQVMQRQRHDERTLNLLMRFPGETASGPAIGPTLLDSTSEPSGRMTADG